MKKGDLLFLERAFYDEVFKMRWSYYLLNCPPCLDINKIEEDRIIFDDHFVAFLTHVRILYIFFNNEISESKEGVEAKIEDYIDNWTIVNPWSKMKSLYLQINSHLSHLDYSRVEDKNQLIYESENIYKNFREIIVNFLNDLSKINHLTKRLKELLQDLEQEIKKDPWRKP